jgi:hypothetical protein
MVIRHIAEVMDDFIQYREKHKVPKDVDVIEVTRDPLDNTTVFFECPVCAVTHRHGCGKEFGSGDGLRDSHCHHMNSYWIREVEY